MGLVNKIKFMALSGITLSCGLAATSFLMSGNKTLEMPAETKQEKPKYPRRGYKGCLEFGTDQKVCAFLYPKKTWDWYK